MPPSLLSFSTHFWAFVETQPWSKMPDASFIRYQGKQPFLKLCRAFKVCFELILMVVFYFRFMSIISRAWFQGLNFFLDLCNAFDFLFELNLILIFYIRIVSIGSFCRCIMPSFGWVCRSDMFGAHLKSNFGASFDGCLTLLHHHHQRESDPSHHNICGNCLWFDLYLGCNDFLWFMWIFSTALGDGRLIVSIYVVEFPPYFVVMIYWLYHDLLKFWAYSFFAFLVGTVCFRVVYLYN